MTLSGVMRSDVGSSLFRSCIRPVIFPSLWLLASIQGASSLSAFIGSLSRMNYGVNGKFPLFTAFKDPLSHTNVLVSYCVLSKCLGLGFVFASFLCLL